MYIISTFFKVKEALKNFELFWKQFTSNNDKSTLPSFESKIGTLCSDWLPKYCLLAKKCTNSGTESKDCKAAFTNQSLPLFLMPTIL